MNTGSNSVYDDFSGMKGVSAEGRGEHFSSVANSREKTSTYVTPIDDSRFNSAASKKISSFEQVIEEEAGMTF